MSKDSKYIKYGKLLGGLIHNLNTPLMGCTGRVELLQMKMEDDRNLNQIAIQLDKINAILVASAYILDKDNTDSVTMIDMKPLLENYFTFLYTDMRFKHQVEKEINLEPRNIAVNPSELVNYLHTLLDYVLRYLEGSSVLEIDNVSENGNPTIHFCLKYEEDNINEDFIEPLKNTLEYLKDLVSEDTLKMFETHIAVTNCLDIKVIINEVKSG